MAAVVKSLASILFSYESFPLPLLRRGNPVGGQLGPVETSREEQEKITCPTCIPLVDLPSPATICHEVPRGELEKITCPTCIPLVRSEVAECSKSSIRSVSFDLTKNAVYEITPYSEVYNGVHPRDFQFGKGLPAPAACFYDPDILPHPILAMDAVHKRSQQDDESSDSDEEFASWRETSRPQLWLHTTVKSLASLSAPALLALVMLCVLVRAFGPQVLTDLLLETKNSQLF